MFFSYAEHIDRPFEEVRRTLASASSEALSSFMTRAHPQEDELRVSVGVGHTPRLSKTAKVSVGDLRLHEDRAVLPLRMSATGPAQLFPRLDADLEIAPADATGTKVTLRGTYAPPLGRIGEAIDRAVLHRLADATLRSFVDEVAGALAAPAAATSAG